MPSMPNKVFNTHSRPSTNPKASYTHLKPSTTNQSPSHPYQALHTHPCPPHYSLALYTHPRSSTQVPGSPHPAQNLIPIPDLPYHHRPSRPPPHPSPPIHTDLKPSTPTLSRVVTSVFVKVSIHIWMAYAGTKGLGWVRRAWDLSGGPRVGVKG